jgi:hypothetical protein
MQAYRRLKIGEAWRSLAPGQGLRVIAVMGLILAAAVILGAVLAGSREQRNLTRKEDHTETLIGNLRKLNDELDRQFADLTIRQSELLQRHAALEASLAASRADRRALAGEAEFLNRYIALTGTGDGAKPADGKPEEARFTEARSPKAMALIDTLCTLWKSGDKQFMRFESGPLKITAQDLEQGRLSPDLQTLLVENFISLDPLQQLRVAEAAQAGKPAKPAAHAPAANTTSAPLMASVGRQAESIKILKSIGFLDGARYEIPRNIAVALQIRRECLPH